MHKIVKKLFKKQKGQAMIEYGLIVSLIAVAVIAAILLLGGKDGGGPVKKNLMPQHVALVTTPIINKVIQGFTLFIEV